MTATRWIAAAFACGVLLALAARAAPGFFNAYLGASRIRFDVMTAEPAGEASYLISVDDFSVLDGLAAEDDDIVAVDTGVFSGIGRVTFAAADSPAIERLRQHPNTAFLLSTTIPLICH